MSVSKRKDIEIDDEGLPIPKSLVKFDDEGLPVPLKKKEPEYPLLYGGVKGQQSLDLRSDYPSKSPSVRQSPVNQERAKIEDYNRKFEEMTGHKEFSLSEPVKPKTLLGKIDYDQKKKSFEEKKYEINREREKEISAVQNRVETGTVKPEQLAELYDKPYGKKIVSETVNQYVPDAGDFGFSKDVFGSEKKWDMVAKDINIKNRPKGVEAQGRYFANLDNELNNEIGNLQVAKVSVSGGTGGGSASVSILPLKMDDANNAEQLGQLLSQIESADYIETTGGERKDGGELIKKINEKLIYLSAQKEIHPEITSISKNTKYALMGANVQREEGEAVPKGGYGQQDEIGQHQFELGLNYIKAVKPNIYKNVIRGINEEGKVSGADFETLSNIGQQIYNQQVFSKAASDPSLIDAETKIDYTSYDTKKADYARIIGERAKQAGGKNRIEFTKDEIKKLGKDLPNQEIVNDLADEEQIGWYDAIPKSGWREAIAQGVIQPIAGIKSTIDIIGESPAETYLRSKKLDTGIGGQLVANEKGQYSAVLPSDRSNIWYDMARGFGQFIPQVLLTKGIGKGLGKIASLETRIGGLSAAEAANLEVYGGTVASTYAQTYGSAYADALQKTGDPGTAKLIGTIDSISSAGFETILPDVKIADKALAGLKRTLANDLVDLIKKGGDPASLAIKARPFVQKFVANTINISGQEVAEEVGTQVVDYVTEAIFSPASVKDRDLGSEVLETAKGTFISMLVPSILGGGGAALSKDFTRDGLNTSALNFSDSKNALDKSLLQKAITQDEYDKSLTLLNLHRNSILSAPARNEKDEVITSEEKMEYAYQDTLSKIYTENKAATNDTEEQNAIQKKIDAAENEKNRILGKPEVIATPIEEKETELTPEQVIVEAAGKGNLEGTYGEMVMQDPTTAKAVLLDLAMQKYGIQQDGTESPEGGRDISMKTSLDVDDAVTKAFPNKESVIAALKPIQNETEVTPEVPDQTGTTGEDNGTATENVRTAEEGEATAETPPIPPVTDESTTVEEEPLKNKSLANRLVNATNVSESAKEGIKAAGLKYEPKSQQEAQDLAKAILDENGIDDSVLRARAGDFGGDVNTLVQTEALSRLKDMEDGAKTKAEAVEFAKKFAEIAINLDEHLRKQGRGISALNFFYKKSALGIQMVENANRKQEFEQWSKPKDKSWKEAFDEMMKEPEFKDLVKEEVKKERAGERESRKEKVHKAIDDTLSKWAKKLSADLPGGTEKQGIGIDEVLKAVGATMKKAYDAGEAIGKIVQDAIDYISDKIGHSEWDKEGFRAEWEQKLKDKQSKKPLTDEELKAKILDKFRNKLKGLSDSQKEDVVRKSFAKIVESGGLDYADFRKIIADVTGRGEMTDAEAKRLRELVNETNAVDEAGKKARTERTQESRKAFTEAEKKAGKAAKELNQLLYNKPNITKRLTSLMQLNTLGIPALVNNPIYNVINHLGVRLPVGIIKTGIERAIQVGAKLMGKEYLPETDVLSVKVQKEFFKKLGLGTKEAVKKFITGLDRADYLNKEIQGDAIRPASAYRDLWAYSQGKKNLTKAQIIDKIIQASPPGITAEIIARTLNLGDKPQRFAAEGAQAAAFAKSLGLKDIDYDLFIDFPREEAYRVYKAKGLSDAEAGKKADYIKDTIVKEGERSTFQQDNMLNDMLNRVFGGQKSGVGGLLKATVVSPYIKIPSNAYWSYYNIVNPEVAMLQSMIYAGKAFAKTKGAKFSFDKPNSSAEKDIHEAKYWLAHAAIGMATRAVIMGMVSAGIYRSGNTGDDTKKEREGEQFYENQGTINVSKLSAWLRGEDPNKVKNGLVIANRWFGHWGTVGNTIARKNEEMTPEQKKEQSDFWDVAVGGMELYALQDFEQGVFGNTQSLLEAMQQGIKTGDIGYGLQRWGVNTLNMFANIVHPAASAQVEKAMLPYYTKAKADTFMQEVKNSMLTRSAILRNVLNQYPPSKIGIWGDRLDKKDNVPMRLFGISRANDDNFAQPIYEDYKKTNDIGLFPPAVMPVLNDKKLNSEQALKLEEYVGHARKALIAPFINDQAEIQGFFVKYSQLKDEDKKYVLQYLYGLGRDEGIKKFVEENKDFKEEEKTVDYLQEIERGLFKTLQKYQ
jgi:hypothetical protein